MKGGSGDDVERRGMRIMSVLEDDWGCGSGLRGRVKWEGVSAR